MISDANSVYGFSFEFVNFFAASVLGIPVPVLFALFIATIAFGFLCHLYTSWSQYLRPGWQ